MKVRITDPAKADLSNIRLYLKSQSPAAARKIGRRLLDACEIVAVWPYVIVYRVAETEVQILRVWRAAKDRGAD